MPGLFAEAGCGCIEEDSDGNVSCSAHCYYEARVVQAKARVSCILVIPRDGRVIDGVEVA